MPDPNDSPPCPFGDTIGRSPRFEAWLGGFLIALLFQLGLCKGASNSNRVTFPFTLECNMLSEHDGKSQLDALDLSAICDKLQDPQGWYRWPNDRVIAAIKDYRKFLHLNRKYPETELVPGPDADEVWHLHVLNTRQYQEDCERLFGRFLHHSPASDMAEHEMEIARENTVRLHMKEFGEAPDNFASCRCNGISCFPAGTMVLMGDHTEKPIEDVLVGEVVVTPFGPARVAELYRPLLGNRPLYEMRNGRKLRTSSEQAVWGRSPETRHEWWTTRDMAQWKYEAEIGAGSAFSPEPVDLTDKEGVEWEFAVAEGWNRAGWKRIDAPHDLQLYDLFLESGGAYFADGYLVKTFPDIPSEVWKRYRHRPVVPPLGAGDGKDDHAPVAGGTFGEAVLV